MPAIVCAFTQCLTCHCKTKQESSSTVDWKNMKMQILSSANNRQQPARKPCIDSMSLSDTKSAEASTSISLDELSAVSSAIPNNTSRVTEVSAIVSLSPCLKHQAAFNYIRQHCNKGELLSAEASICCFLCFGGTNNTSRFLQGAALPTHGTTSQPRLKLWSIFSRIGVQSVTAMDYQPKMRMFC